MGQPIRHHLDAEERQALYAFAQHVEATVPPAGRREGRALAEALREQVPALDEVAIGQVATRVGMEMSAAASKPTSSDPGMISYANTLLLAGMELTAREWRQPAAEAGQTVDGRRPVPHRLEPDERKLLQGFAQNVGATVPPSRLEKGRTYAAMMRQTLSGLDEVAAGLVAVHLGVLMKQGAMKMSNANIARYAETLMLAGTELTARDWHQTGTDSAQPASTAPPAGPSAAIVADVVSRPEQGTTNTARTDPRGAPRAGHPSPARRRQEKPGGRGRTRRA